MKYFIYAANLIILSLTLHTLFVLSNPAPLFIYVLIYMAFRLGVGDTEPQNPNPLLPFIQILALMLGFPA